LTNIWTFEMGYAEQPVAKQIDVTKNRGGLL